MKLANDHWLTFDKLQHAGRAMLIYSVTHIAFPNIWNWVPFAIAVTFAILYEFWDAHRLRRTYPLAFRGQTLIINPGAGETTYRVEQVRGNTITFSEMGANDSKPT